MTCSTYSDTYQFGKHPEAMLIELTRLYHRTGAFDPPPLDFFLDEGKHIPYTPSLFYSTSHFTNRVLVLKGMMGKDCIISYLSKFISKSQNLG